MKSRLRRFFSILISVLLLHSQSYAQSAAYTGYLGLKNYSPSQGTEYTSGNTPGTVLMKVNLWGAVGRPGIHNIPVKTDLITLLSYAGGPEEAAEMDEVIIKREVGNTRKIIKVDLEELITDVSHHHVELAPNDVVVVPRHEPILSKDGVQLIYIGSFILSIVVAAAVIDRYNRN